MPTIKFEISKLSEETKRELVKEITSVSSKITGIREEAFVVFINEYEKDNISVGGTLLSDKMKGDTNAK